MGQRLGIAARTARRPGHPDVRRAGHRARPRRRPVDQDPDEDARRRGRTVFVSSHLMSKIENTADHLLVIGRGKLIADCTAAQEFIARNFVRTVRVRTPQPRRCAAAVALAARPRRCDGADGAIVVQGLDAEPIGDLAYDKAIRLHELAPAQASLEQAFMELTASSVEFRPRTDGPRPRAAGRAGRLGRGGLRWPSTAQTPAPARAAGPARGRAGLARRAPLRVHQDPLGPVHLLDAVRPGRGHHRDRRAGLRGRGVRTAGTGRASTRPSTAWSAWSSAS